MTLRVTMFAIVFAVAIIFFLWSCWQRFSLVTLGKADNRFDRIGLRIVNMLLYAF